MFFPSNDARRPVEAAAGGARPPRGLLMAAAAANETSADAAAVGTKSSESSESSSSSSSSSSASSANNEEAALPPSVVSPSSGTPVTLHMLRSNNQDEVGVVGWTGKGGGGGTKAEDDEEDEEEQDASLWVGGMWMSSDLADWRGNHSTCSTKYVDPTPRTKRASRSGGFAVAVVEPSSIEMGRRRGGPGDGGGSGEGESKRDGLDLDTGIGNASTEKHKESCIQWLERPSTIGKLFLLIFCLGGVFLAIVLYQKGHHLPILPEWLQRQDGDDDDAGE